MRRITVTLDDDLVEFAEAEVAAGRAPSVSAWVAKAIRAKARARAELLSELDELERRDPTPPQVVAKIARSIGISPTAVSRAIKHRSQTQTKRQG